METQHQQQIQLEAGGNGKNTSTTPSTNPANSNYLCRQSSTRWTPTTEQIRILKDLYYNTGVRSPNADQIQKISARLRQYGKIEGKNVFYWFQNHKARERQKKRFTTTPSNTTNIGAAAGGGGDHHMLVSPVHRNGGGGGIWKGGADDKYGSSFGAPGVSCPSSSAAVGMVSVGQVVGGYGHDCAISAYGNGAGIYGGYPSAHSGFQWAGMQYPNYPTSYSLLDGKSCRFQEEDHHQLLEEDQEQLIQHNNGEIETLPLFPMHTDHHQDNLPCSSSNNYSFYSPMMIRPAEPEPEPYYTNSCHWLNGSGGGGAAAAARASLELSLNSYGTHWQNF